MTVAGLAFRPNVTYCWGLVIGGPLDKRKIQRVNERWQEDQKRSNLQCLAEPPQPITESPKVVKVQERSDRKVGNSEGDSRCADKILGPASTAKQGGVPSLNAVNSVNDRQRGKNRACKPLLGAPPRGSVCEIFRIVECGPMRSSSPDAALG